MSENYKISIILPIFNVENYLPRSLDSIVKQTIGVENLEVIMVNDASTDNSKQIIDEYAKKYTNFIAIHKTANSGNAGEPRNIGLKHASAEYVMFFDPDDEFCLDYCEVMYNTITQRNVDIVRCNAIMVTENKETFRYYYDQKVDEVLLTTYDTPLKLFAVMSGIHKTSLILDNNITFPHYVGEDVAFTINEWIHLGKMLYLNNYFGYKYFIRGDSVSHTPNIENITGLLNAISDGYSLMKGNEREDLVPIYLGRCVDWTISKIFYYRTSRDCRLKYYKELYEIENKIESKLIIESLSSKIANMLIMKKLFNLTDFILTIYVHTLNSKFLVNIYKKLYSKRTS